MPRVKSAPITIKLFTGYDEREAAGLYAFEQSVLSNSSALVAFIPMSAKQHRDGSNAFTYSRFLVPELCGYDGFAIFADGADMICLEDIAKLWALRERRFAVQVVKHDYRTKHPRKYVGTEMECDNRDYPRKNWSSLMIWNCGHQQNRILTPLNVAEWSGLALHGFNWLADDLIGELPIEWNWLVDEYGANPAAKLLHHTAGIPGIRHYSSGPGAEEWREAHAKANRVPA